MSVILDVVMLIAGEVQIGDPIDVVEFGHVAASWFASEPVYSTESE